MTKTRSQKARAKQEKNPKARAAATGKRQKAAVSVRTESVGAARAAKPVRIGMQDLQAHRIAWVAGYTYVGNGTLGATDDVFFRPVGTPTTVVNGATGGGAVPVLGADTGVGQSYVSDIEKHYARKRVRQTKLHLIPLQPSTANSCMVYVAPVRGAATAGDTVPVTTNTAAPTVANTLGMAGVASAPSWESTALDLTPYIAGGSGGPQNEFAIQSPADDAIYWGHGAIDMNGIAPCSFVVSGQNSTAALRGTNVHLVVIEQVIDLLDFISGNVGSAAVAFNWFRALLEVQGRSVTEAEARVLYNDVARKLGAGSGSQCLVLR